MAQQLREIMTKAPKVLDVDSTIVEAARVMRESDIGMVLVRNQKGVCGVVTDRDLVVRGLAEGCDPARTTLENVYSEHLVKLEASESIENAVNLMRKKAIRRIPVMENGECVGVVSLGDLALERDPSSALGGISAAPPNH
jgi:CBS domain-containing protein